MPDDASDDLDHFLPGVGMSTCAAISILCRWATQEPGNGGLRSPAQKQGAIDCLVALERILVGSPEIHIGLNFNGGVFWPGLIALPAAATVALKDGSLDLQAWRDYIHGDDAGPAATKQWALLHDQFGERVARVPAHSALLFLATKGLTLTPVFAQLVAHIAVAIDSAVRASCEGRLERHGLEFDACFPSILHTVGSETSMMANLCWYVDSGVAASHDEQNLCLVSDVGHTGVKLDIGIVTMPSNLAILAVPQVPLSRH